MVIDYIRRAIDEVSYHIGNVIWRIIVSMERERELTERDIERAIAEAGTILEVIPPEEYKRMLREMSSGY